MNVRAAAVALLGSAATLLFFLRHPPDLALPDPALLGAPQAAKLAEGLRALGALLVINLGAFTLGDPLARRLRRPDDLAVPCALACGFFVQAHVVLVLAMAHASHPIVIAMWGFVGALAGAVVMVRRGAIARRPTVDRRTAAFVVCVLLLLLPTLLDAFVPNWGWDALTYHLALPDRYLHDGGMHVVPESIFSVYALGTEMLYTIGLALQGPVVAKLLNLQFGLMTLWVLWRWAGRSGRMAAMCAVAIVVSDALFRWELTVVYTDLALAFLALLAVEASAAWLSTRHPRDLARVGFFLGACMTVRLAALAFGLAVGVVLLLDLLRRRPFRPRPLLAPGAIAAACVLPWIVRNLIFTGNPLSPLFQSVFHRPGHEFFDPGVLDQTLAAVSGIGRGRSPLELAKLPYTLTIGGSPGVYVGGFGYLVGVMPVVGFAAAWVAGLRRDPRVRAPAAIAGIFVLLWFFGSQEARHLLPVVAIGGLVGGIAFSELARSPTAARLLLATPIIAAIVQGLGAWSNVGFEWGYAFGGLPKEQLERLEPARRVSLDLARVDEHHKRLWLLLEGRGFLFREHDYIRDEVAGGSPSLALVARSRDADDLACRLAKRGVTHVVVNMGFVDRHPTFDDTYGFAEYRRDLDRLRTFLEGHTTPVVAAEKVVAAELHPPPAGCGSR